MKQSLIYLIIILICCGCEGHKGTRTDKDYSTNSNVGTGGEFNMGESVYKIVRKNVGKSPTHPVEKVEALERKKVDFISSVNSVFTDDIREGLKPTLQTSIDLIKDGTLPSMTEDMKTILGALIEDEATLDAIARLAKTKRGLFSISNPNLMALLARITNYREVEEVYKAVSHIVEENELVVEETLRFVSEFLKEIEDEDPEDVLDPNNVNFCDIMLNQMEIKPGAELGAPEYEVRIDVRGLAVVNQHPVNKNFYEPFVDTDEDGLPDTNSQGKFIDIDGKVIEIPPFGTGNARDDHGRALSNNGDLLYEYFDVKRTFLALLLQLAGSSLEDGMLEHALVIANGVLGERIQNDGGTPADDSDDYMGYPHNNNPLLDLMYAYVEIYKYEHSPKTLKAISNLFKEQPVVAEKVLVALGKLFQILRNPEFKDNITNLHNQVKNESNVSFLDELIPLLDNTFQTPNNRDESTARILFRTFNERLQEIRGLPKAYAKMFRYSDVSQQLTKDQTGKPSAYERLTHIVYESDQCVAPIIGNLAEFYISVIAGPVNILGVDVPFTVENVTDLINIPFVRALLCPEIHDDNVLGLYDLMNSGGLAAITPLAETLVPMGETRLLVEMHNIMSLNYDIIRPNEALLAEIFDSGVIEAFFDVVNIMSEVQVPGTEEVVADVIVDSVANLIHRGNDVHDRLGQPVPTLLHLFVNPLDELQTRAKESGVENDLEALFYAFTDYLILTEVDDKGTTDPSDDEEILVYKTLVPIMGQVLEVLSNQLDENPAQRRMDLIEEQLAYEDFMTGRGLPALVDFLNVVNASSEKEDILDAIINLLTPNKEREDDIFGALCKILARDIQFASISDRNAMNQVLRFAGDILDPEKEYIVNMIKGYKRLIVRDEGSIALSLARNLFYQGENGELESPAQVFISLFDRMNEIDGADLSNPTADVIKGDFQTIMDFMNDKKNGMEMIFATIKRKHGTTKK